MKPLAKWALVGCVVYLVLYGVHLIIREAPSTPPHLQSKTTSEPVHPIPVSDPHNSIPRLLEIPEGTPAFGTAQEILARLRPREAESEPAIEAYIAKEAVENRKEYAAAIERLLFEDGMESRAAGSAPRRSREAAPPASSRRTAGSRVAAAVPGAAAAPNPAAVAPSMPATAAAAVPTVAAPPALMPMTPCGEDRPCSVPSVNVTSAFSSY